MSSLLKAASSISMDVRSKLLETLKKLDVTNAKVSVVDKGALDCTLKARVEGAVFRSVNEDPDTPNPWEVL